MERQLVESLRGRGLEVLNDTRPTTKVWSSRYHHGAFARTWGVQAVADALVDMRVLAEATLFVANPASTFSGCVRDMRAAAGRSLSSTQVGIPPHDETSLAREA
uniref:Uncharacterized protein n=1 Tax=Prymnesium polylepis TaxID=72548 RepID=A0A7S4J7U3_9EUKA|mmetsp:Transcript_52775/g.145901  ORF Transcript_52775/g.145901 Transcript_52775/m.145901 type:complete len:104 (+) Transcript_52775:809-1120(+)